MSVKVLYKTTAKASTDGLDLMTGKAYAGED